MLVAGRVIDERYEILQHLGDGGMGSVFKAREIGLERTLAIKVLHTSHLTDPESRERFRREGVLLSRLNHENIMRCYRLGIWEQENLPYIAMEFLDGIPLSRLLAEQTKLPLQYVLKLAQQLCSGMEHAHKYDIVHRDLKPANIMVLKEPGREDQIKILDFGLAGMMHDSASNFCLTQTGELIGSIYYMSPEQCLGKRADERADIYSLGCVLYETLTGAPPLVTDNPVGMMHLHSNVYPPPLEEKLCDADLMAGLNSVLMKAMAKQVDLRFQSMHEFGEALALVAAGKGDSIAPFITTARKPPSAGRARKILLSSSLTLLCALTALSVAYRFDSKPTRPALPRADQATLIPYNLLRCVSIRESLLDPDQIETWIKKYGQSYPHDKIHATWLLYNANRLTLDDCIETMKTDFRQVLKSRKLLSDKELFRSAKFLLAVIQRRDGLAGSLETVANITEHKIDDRTMNKIRRDQVEALRASGLYEEEEKLLRTIKPYSAREYIGLANCLRYQGKLTESERQHLLHKFDDLADAVWRDEDGFVVARGLMELNELNRAKNTKMGYGQFELAYMALIYSLQGAHREADEILQDPAMYGYRLPLRVWNSQKMGKQVQASLLQDIKDKTHDVRDLIRVGYHFFESSPGIAKSAIENGFTRLDAQSFASAVPNASLMVEMLIHTGQLAKARKFAENLFARKPRHFSAVHFEELLLRLEYARTLRLQGETQTACNVLASVLEESQRWPAARPFCEPRILAEMGLNEQASGRLDSAQSLFEKSMQSCRGNVAVLSVDKVLIAEAFARLCIERKEYAKAKLALAESNKLIRRELREPWQTWMPLCPDYSRLRLITDKDF
jgi:serine/threonine protein kinase